MPTESTEIILALIPPKDLLSCAHQAVIIASEIARRSRKDHSNSISFKGDKNLVTSADLAAERAIVDYIKNRFPEHKILAEETAQTLEPERYGEGYTWIVDPIDGTTNYAHGHFHVGISVACTYNGESVAAAVAAPFLGEIFTAIKDGGAFLNGEKISCTQTRKVSDALITTGFPYSRANARNICLRIERVVRQCRDLRRLGAASLDLCWVACGRLDAYFEECVQSWDVAAGVLIAREAGAVINHFAYDSELQRMTSRYPGDLYADNIVACSPGIEHELMSLLDQTPGED
jgi:myo-inositol-1(or 4)-monophosphatase